MSSSSRRKEEYNSERDHYYSNRSTYIPPSRNTSIPPSELYKQPPKWISDSPPSSSSSNYDRYPPSPIRKREDEIRSNRRLDNRRSGRYETSNLFHGLTFYINVDEDDKKKSWKIRDLIKRHGGLLCRKPDSPIVTHIIILDISSTSYSSPAISKNPIYLIDKKGSPPGFGEWNKNNLINYLARLCENGNINQNGRKFILKDEWLYDCIRERRVIDERGDFGGWEIKATYDRNLVNDCSPVQKSIPSSPPRSRSQETQIHSIPQDPRKVLREAMKSASPAKNNGAREYPVERQSSDQAEQIKEPIIMNNEEGISSLSTLRQNVKLQPASSPTREKSMNMDMTEIEDNVKEEKVEIMKDVKPIIVDTSERELCPEKDRQNGRDDSRSATPVTVPRANSAISISPYPEDTGLGCRDQERLTINQEHLPSQPLTQSSIKQDRSPTPSTSGHTRLDETHVSERHIYVHNQDKKVFARGLLPLTFYVAGSGREKKFTEMMIIEKGGLIVPSTYATMSVIPISPNESFLNDVAIRDIIRHVPNQPGRVAISVDWVEHCIEKDVLLPLTEYIIHDNAGDPPTPPSSIMSRGHKRSPSISTATEEGSMKKSRYWPNGSR